MIEMDPQITSPLRLTYLRIKIAVQRQTQKGRLTDDVRRFMVVKLW